MCIFAPNIPPKENIHHSAYSDCRTMEAYRECFVAGAGQLNQQINKKLEQYGVAPIFWKNLYSAFKETGDGKSTPIRSEACQILFQGLFPNEKQTPTRFPSISLGEDKAKTSSTVQPESMKLFLDIFQSLLEAYRQKGYIVFIDKDMEAILIFVFADDFDLWRVRTQNISNGTVLHGILKNLLWSIQNEK